MTKSPMPETISVTPLDKPSDDSVGLLPGSVTGLPRALWGPTPTTRVAELLAATDAYTLPALQALLYQILLAEVDPPTDADGRGALFLARVDRLLDLGALDQAMALLQLASVDHPETFRRWFDVALLLGEEDRACATMRDAPNVAPTFPARIFCLARGGDWNAAALTLQTARALGFVTAEEDALLARFLDPELYEDEPPLPPPSRPSPLVWRMMEAIGEAVPTNTLPLAFAHGDLRSNTGWKAQIEAAERLARSGALAPNRLLGLYDERKAAASGGVWDRVAAMQSFDKALSAADPAGIALTLPLVWDRMVTAGQEVIFAELFGETLSRLSLDPDTSALALRIGLLSSAYEAVALARVPAGAEEAFLIGLARGSLAGTVPPDGMATAIVAGFTATEIPAEFSVMLEQGRLGEAILLASQRISSGATGEVRLIGEGLAVLRKVGLEDVARRAALELMLLDRRG